MNQWKCPVCELPLNFAPWKGMSASDEICPRCGIQFGYDDCTSGNEANRQAIYTEWRERWIAAGRPEKFHGWIKD